MTLRYETFRETPESVTAESVAALYRRAGLHRPVDDLPRIARMLSHANLLVCAWDVTDNRLVGIARALTDFSFCCYLSDLAVDADFQRQGIGQHLIHLVQKAIGPESMLLLLSAPDAMDYYPHIGFTKVENGWIIPRSES